MSKLAPQDKKEVNVKDMFMKYAASSRRHNDGCKAIGQNDDYHISSTSSEYNNTHSSDSNDATFKELVSNKPPSKTPKQETLSKYLSKDLSEDIHTIDTSSVEIDDLGTASASDNKNSTNRGFFSSLIHRNEDDSNSREALDISRKTFPTAHKNDDFVFPLSYLSGDDSNSKEFKDVVRFPTMQKEDFQSDLLTRNEFTSNLDDNVINLIDDELEDSNSNSDSLTCPICGFSANWNLTSLNNHVDSCLNKQAISEILRNDKISHSGHPSSSSSGSSTSTKPQLSKKRLKGAAETDQENPKKSKKVQQTVISFFSK